jgi:hypothetical protein
VRTRSGDRSLATVQAPCDERLRELGGKASARSIASDASRPITIVPMPISPVLAGLHARFADLPPVN